MVAPLSSLFPIVLQLLRSGVHQLVLQDVNLSTSGRYKCQITLSGPPFHTEQRDKSLSVISEYLFTADVTRFGEISPLWQKFRRGIFKNLFLFWQNAEPTLAICDIIGLILIVANGHILTNNLTIWSHCFSAKSGAVVDLIIFLEEIYKI